MALKLKRNSDVISTPIGGFCTNCMVLSAKAGLSDSKGVKLDSASGINDHYIIVTDVGHPMVVPPVRARCANGKFERFNLGEMAMEAPSETAESYEVESGSLDLQRPVPKPGPKSPTPKGFPTSSAPKALSTASAPKALSTASAPKALSTPSAPTSTASPSSTAVSVPAPSSMPSAVTASPASSAAPSSSTS